MTEAKAAAALAGPGTQAPGEVAFFDGRFCPLAEAKVPITTHAFNYGTGCFEGIRAYWNPEQQVLYVLRLQDHVERLVRSARILNLDLAEQASDLNRVLVELVARNGCRQDVYIRPIVYKAGATIKLTLSGLKTGFCAYVTPMGEYLALDRGLEVTFSAWRRIEDNAIPARAKPTGAYINATMASDEAQARGFDEALMLTADGHLAEASSANVFLVEHKTLITPPTSDDILGGITRDCVIQIAGRLGLAVQERRVDRSEVLAADEVFLCGTGVQIAPVSVVDGRRIGGGQPGPVTLGLQGFYLDVARGRRPEFEEWRTPVRPA